jgi:phage tail protein X
MHIYVTKQGDMVDAIAKRAYGTERGGTTEALLEANRGIADLGAKLPENITIIIPDLPPRAPTELRTVDLWA